MRNDLNVRRIAELGETALPDQWAVRPSVGDRVRLFLRYGYNRLFQGSVFEGTVQEVSRPEDRRRERAEFEAAYEREHGRPFRRLGVPLFDPNETLYLVADYSIDGKQYGDATGTIRLDATSIIWLDLPTQAPAGAGREA